MAQINLLGSLFPQKLVAQEENYRLSILNPALAFERSKKLLQKVITPPAGERQVFICLPKPLKSCRLRISLQHKGVRHSFDQSLNLAATQTFFLDRFEK